MQLQPPRVESDRAELLFGNLPTELTKPIRFGTSVCPACRHRCKLGQKLRAFGRCNRPHNGYATLRPLTAILAPLASFVGPPMWSHLAHTRDARRETVI